MTNKEAIKGLLNVKMQMSEETPFTEAVDLAIRSLQAWEEVLNQLQEWKDSAENEHEQKISYAYFSAIKIIKQKLAEIEEVR